MTCVHFLDVCLDTPCRLFLGFYIDMSFVYCFGLWSFVQLWAFVLTLFHLGVTWHAFLSCMVV